MKEQILPLLPNTYLWQDLLHCYHSIDSTNTQAKKIALSGAPHGTVLIADQQTGGRGRMGRSFQSPEGMGIYMSIILRPPCGPDRLMHLTCATAVAMCDAIESAAGIRPGIKWTNDLVVGRKKLGGILTELVTIADKTCAIIGIGINCCQEAGDFPPELRDMACSLSMVTGKTVSKESIVAAMLTALQKMDQTLLTQKASLMDAYRRDCITLGKDVCLLRSEQVYYGHATDIDENGGLLVTFRDGHSETVNSGEISIRGMYGYV